MGITFHKKEILRAPMLATFGGGASRGFGRGLGPGVVLAASTSSTLQVKHLDGSTYNNSGTISLLQGYAATLRVHLVGDATLGGASCCGNCGRSASGEYAQFDIVMGGDETNASYNFDNGSNQGQTGTLSLTINGGTRNGTIVRAGSGGPGASYSNACPPTSRSGTITGSATRVTYGAFGRASGNSYNDGYYYSGCSGYGTQQNGYSGYGGYGGCSAGQRGAIFFQYLNDY